MQKNHSIVPVTPQKPLRGHVLSDDRDYVSIGDLQDIFKLYANASESEGKQFFLALSKYLSCLLSSKHFKKTLSGLVNKKPANWQKLLTLKSVWESIESHSEDKLLVQRSVYVAMEKVVRGESDDDTVRFVRRSKAHLSIVHKALMDLSGGTEFLESMETFGRAMQAQAQLLLTEWIKPWIADMLRTQNEMIENLAKSVRISVGIFASFQTEVVNVTKLGEQISASLGVIKPFFDSLEPAPRSSRFSIGYFASIATGPRENIQLAIYKQTRETKEYQRRLVLLQETQFLITNPGAKNEHIEALYSGQYTPTSLADMLRRPLLPNGIVSSYTKTSVYELIDNLRFKGKEKKLIECLANTKGRFVRVRDIIKEVGTKALPRMVSTLNKKLNKAWKIERDGSSFDGFRYRLVKLRVE